MYDWTSIAPDLAMLAATLFGVGKGIVGRVRSATSLEGGSMLENVKNGGIIEEGGNGSTAGSTGKYSGKSYSGIRNPDVDFTNKRGNSTLKTHFDDHKADFSYTNETEYLNGARNFLEKPPTFTTQSFVSEDGTYFRYDTATNEFGIMNKYGGTSTYFKPDEGLKYWQEQIKLYTPED